MSGGTAVQTESHGSGAGAAEGEPRPWLSHGSASEVLGLDGGRACKAPNEKKKCQPFTAGDGRARDGSRMAETARGGLGSQQPDPQGCAQEDSLNI